MFRKSSVRRSDLDDVFTAVDLQIKVKFNLEVCFDRAPHELSNGIFSFPQTSFLSVEKGQMQCPTFAFWGMIKTTKL